VGGIGFSQVLRHKYLKTAQFMKLDAVKLDAPLAPLNPPLLV